MSECWTFKKGRFSAKRIFRKKPLAWGWQDDKNFQVVSHQGYWGGVLLLLRTIHERCWKHDSTLPQDATMPMIFHWVDQGRTTTGCISGDYEGIAIPPRTVVHVFTLISLVLPTYNWGSVKSTSDMLQESNYEALTCKATIIIRIRTSYTPEIQYRYQKWCFGNVGIKRILTYHFSWINTFVKCQDH